ncbi:MAG: membrane protein insertase YidC [Prevotella sp.]|nr:membrane protein insertase YidC [Bacteroides sp.]MCM1366493.1 membrane protein insertase YidC [Prevotella sp.]MCM1436832.1 membrane protein insertase YidC [Prevotella sp.]
MDKNTVYGLLLMAAVFFGYMWLRPKPEAQHNSVQENTENTQTSPQAVSLSDTELDWLRQNIVQNGQKTGTDSASTSYTWDSNGISLRLDGDSLSGYVTVDGKQVTWKEISDGSAPMTLRAAALEAVRSASESMGKFGRFAQFLTGTDKKLVLENDALRLTLSSKSGSITKAELKDYSTEYSADENEKRLGKVVMFEGDKNSFSFRMPLPQSISTADLYFRPVALNDSTVRMTLDVTPDAFWGIEYTLPKGKNYVVKMRVVQKNMAAIAQSNNRMLGIDWHQDLKRQEKGRMFEERNSALYYKYAGGSVEHLSEAKNDSEEREAKVKWIAFKNQFFSSILVSKRPFQTADFNSEVLKGSDYLKSMTADATVNDYDWNVDVPAEFDWFIGPNLYPLLSSIDDKLDKDEDMNFTKLIPLGWSIFRWINTLIIIPIFNFLGFFISNYGIIILILTLFIKLVLFPLTYKSYKSQAKMRILAPDIKVINDKYPGQENAMLRQQKTMELYSKAGASPFSGCLPMLLQMPILFAMFSFFPSCIELRGQSFLWAHDLSAPDAIISWSGNIPLVTEYFGNHISLFCLLMTVTNIIYTYINMQNQPGQMPGMKWMMYLMPVFFMIFFNNYAAGLSYYYFLSLLITIIQTYAFRYVIKEEDVRKKMKENAKKPRKKSGFMARLEEMQRQQQQMLKEQQKAQAKHRR